jgi:hypothetical protein
MCWAVHLAVFFGVSLLQPSAVLAKVGNAQYPFQTSSNQSEMKVPGYNPFEFCSDPKPYILQISSLCIEPLWLKP